MIEKFDIVDPVKSYLSIDKNRPIHARPDKGSKWEENIKDRKPSGVMQ